METIYPAPSLMSRFHHQRSVANPIERSDDNVIVDAIKHLEARIEKMEKKGDKK